MATDEAGEPEQGRLLELLVEGVIIPLRSGSASGSAWVEGQTVGHRLLNIAQLFADPEYAGFSSLLNEAAHLAFAGAPSVSSASDPARGLRAAHPVWSMLVSRGMATGPQSLDVIRGAVLYVGHRQAIAVNRAPGSVASVIRASIERLEHFPDPLGLTRSLREPLAGAFTRLIAAKASKEHSKVGIAVELCNAAIHALADATLIERTPAVALERLVRSFAEVSLPRKSKPRKRPPPASPVGGANVYIGSPPPGYNSGDDERPTRPLVTPPISSVQSSLHADRQTAIRSQYLIGTQLLTDGPETLRPEEARACATHLLHVYASASHSGNRLSAQACALWLLALSTARGIEDLVRAPLAATEESPTPNVRCEISRCLRFWRTRVPDHEHFFKSRSASPIKPEATITEPWLPLPQVLVDALSAIRRSHPPSPIRLFPGNAEAILAEAAALKSSLRLQVTPRFAEGRARRSILAILYEQTHDPTLAQILAGDTLGFSPAPQHYHSIRYGDLVRAYRSSTTELFPDMRTNPDSALPDDPIRKVGAPITNYGEQVYRAVAVQLRHEITRAAIASARAERAIARCNAVTRYTAHLLMAAVAHRCTYWIGDIRADDFDPQGWCALTDKQLDLAVSVRVCAVPDIVFQQINILRHILLEVAGTLPVGRKGKPATHSASTLRAAAEGHKPLFVWLAPNGKARPLTADDLRQGYSAENGLPGNLFRSRLRVLLTRQGVDPADIYRQLGHIVGNEVPFGHDSIDSVVAFAQRVRPAIATALETDGWCVAPSTVARQASKPWPGLQDIRSDLARSESRERQQLGDRPSDAPTDKKRTAVDRAAHRSAIGEHVSTLVADLRTRHQDAGPVAVTEAAIQACITRVMTDDDMADYAAQILTLLRGRLKLLRRREGWTGALPPRIFQDRGPEPAILRTHLRARRAAVVLREQALRPRKATAQSPTAALGRLAVLLTLEGLAPNYDRLLQVLTKLRDRDFAARTDDDRRLVVEYPLPESVGGRAMSLGLTTSMAARTWVEQATDGALSVAGIESAIGTVVDVRLLASGSKGHLLEGLIALGQAAARIEQPGVVWACLTRDDPHTLDAMRTQELQQDLSGARAPCVAPPDIAAISLPDSPPHLSAHSAGNQQALRQLTALTRALHVHVETASGQQLKRDRYAQARTLLDETLKDPATDLNIAMLASFARGLVADNSRRIKTAHDYLTQIGRRLLLSANGEMITMLDGDTLESLYDSIVHCRSSKRSQPELAARLLQFHHHHKDRLAEFDDSSLRRLAGQKKVGPPRIGVCTDTEYALAVAILDRLAVAGQLTADEVLQLNIWSSLLFRLGLRASEPLGIRLRDLYPASPHTLLRIGRSSLAAVKTWHSNRTFAIDELLPPDEASALRSWRHRRMADVGDHDRPLLSFRSPHRTKEMSDLLLRIFRHVSGGKITSLHILRHSRASQWLADRIQSPACGSFEARPRVHRLLGQSRRRISVDTYWHLSHLTGRDVIGSDLSSAAIGMLRSEHDSTSRQQRRRSQQSGRNENRVSTSGEPAIALIDASHRDIVEAFPIDAKLSASDILELLIRLYATPDVLRALSASRCTSTLPALILQMICGFALEHGVLIIPKERISALAAAISVEHGLLHRRFRTLSLTGLTLRRESGGSLHKLTASEISLDHLHLALGGSLKDASDRSERQQRALELLDIDLNRPTAPLLIASVLIWQRAQRAI